MKVRKMNCHTNKHRDLAGSQAAMIRAARKARELARQHNQPLAFFRDGKVVHIWPDDLPSLPDELPKQ